MRRGHLSAHRRVWGLLALALPAIVAAALWHRAPAPVDNPVTRLDAEARP